MWLEWIDQPDLQHVCFFHETCVTACCEFDFKRPVTGDEWERNEHWSPALLMLYCTCTKWLQQKIAVKSTERQTITPLNPKDNMQTHRHIDITSKPIHIFERKQRIFSPILPNASLSSYPSQNCLFFSFSPIKVIMCQRRKRNMMIMIMTVKTRRGSLWTRHRCKARPRQLYPKRRIWHRRARNMLPYGTKRKEIKADPWTPRDSNAHSMWKGDTGVTAQYLLIALRLIYNRSSGNQQLPFKWSAGFE